MSRHRRSVESRIYRALREYNDVKAVRNGRIGRRIGRRIYGRATSKLARKLFG